jgi:hypothetical protein
LEDNHLLSSKRLIRAEHRQDPFAADLFRANGSPKEQQQLGAVADDKGLLEAVGSLGKKDDLGISRPDDTDDDPVAQEVLREIRNGEMETADAMALYQGVHDQRGRELDAIAKPSRQPKDGAASLPGAWEVGSINITGDGPRRPDWDEHAAEVRTANKHNKTSIRKGKDTNDTTLATSIKTDLHDLRAEVQGFEQRAEAILSGFHVELHAALGGSSEGHVVGHRDESPYVQKSSSQAARNASNVVRNGSQGQDVMEVQRAELHGLEPHSNKVIENGSEAHVGADSGSHTQLQDIALSRLRAELHNVEEHTQAILKAFRDELHAAESKHGNNSRDEKIWDGLHFLRAELRDKNIEDEVRDLRAELQSARERNADRTNNKALQDDLAALRMELHSVEDRVTETSRDNGVKSHGVEGRVLATVDAIRAELHAAISQKDKNAGDKVS